MEGKSALLDSVQIETNSGVRARAKRFSLQIPLRYRINGDRAWREGQSENISSSGVLFRSGSCAELSAAIEMSFVLPVEISEGAAEVFCYGKIVRTSPFAECEDLHLLAARILRYRLLRPWSK
jgi:hypothetical protein